VQEAVEETGKTKSDLLHDALVHYIRSNPDHIEAFRPERNLEDLSKELAGEWPC
jgi:hypothetical protein